MISVITGDLINSRLIANPQEWIEPLKSLFASIGPNPKSWEIYRGDSFQVEIVQPEYVFFNALRIKATLKCFKELDVRMGIGIGEASYKADRITESNGAAFIYSGEQLERLKKDKQTLAIKSPWPVFDQEMNLFIRLGLIAMDNWKPKTAELVRCYLDHPDKGQQEIADILGINQSSVSERQTRAHLSEILELDAMFREKLKTYIANDHPVT